MITIDKSETRRDSKMLPVPGASYSTTLEHDTGADAMVSPLGMPYTPTLLHHHLEAGAVLIQIKRGEDMVSSIATGAINVALARMREAGAKFAWQRVIMSTGIFVPDLDTGKVLLGEPVKSRQGDTYINLFQARQGSPDYKSFSTMRRCIMLRGGSYLPLTCDEEIPRELAALETNLKELPSVKEIWPNSDKMYDDPLAGDVFQEPVEVKDWRPILAMFPGVGKVRATALRDAMLADYKVTDTLLQALMWATGNFDIKHWGKKTVQKVREMLGLPDWADLAVEVKEEFKK